MAGTWYGWVRRRNQVRGKRDGVLDQDGCEDREKWIDLGVGVDKIATEWI